jgi:BioD-like phosphotransacetylase family protein
MANRIFVAATGQHCGKTTTSLALLYLARKKYSRIGFIKPFGAKLVMARGLCVDKDAALMAGVFGLGRLLRWMSPVVVHPDTTRRVVDGEISVRELRERILSSFAELEKRCDFIIIEGSGHPGVGSVMQLSNARIAKMLHAPVLLVTEGGLGKVVDDVHLSLPLFREEQTRIRALLVNKIIREKRDAMTDYLQRALSNLNFPVMAGFDWEPVLSNPTLRRISSILDLPLMGSRRHGARIIHHVQVGAAPFERVAELLKDSSLVVVSSNREDLLMGLARLYRMPEQRSRLGGLIITGLLPVPAAAQKMLTRSRVPYFRAELFSTTEIVQKLREDVAKITDSDTEKLEKVRVLAEEIIDFHVIDKACSQC